MLPKVAQIYHTGVIVTVSYTTAVIATSIDLKQIHTAGIAISPPSPQSLITSR